MPGSTTLRDCKALETIVKKQAGEGRPYAAICAAPAVALGSWGLLKGLKVRTNICIPVPFARMHLTSKIVSDLIFDMLILLQATCYPSFMEQLSSSASAVESRVQKDGKVVTSRGPGTTMEYAVTLVELLYGKEKADEVSGPMVLSNIGLCLLHCHVLIWKICYMIYLLV